MNQPTILGPDGHPVVNTGNFDDFKVLEGVKCPHCHHPAKPLVAPWSPQFAKIECRYVNCGQTFEVETRESAYVDIEKAVERQKDKNDHATRAPVTNSRIVTG